jgi:hypothetical protein
MKTDLKKGAWSTASVVTTGVPNWTLLHYSGPTHSRSINLIHGIAQISSCRAVEMTTSTG